MDYSVIIPAYNEEKFLPDTLTSIREAMAQMSLRSELIVVDNNSTDSTASVAAKGGARVVFEPHNQISVARNAGAREAQGQYLLFVDADTRISAELLQSALKVLNAGAVGGGALIQFDSP